MKDTIKVIGFDADDTLWVNEPFYRDTEKQFARILSPYYAENEVNDQLFKTEMQNLALYGYGAKSFILSMIETALRLSENKITAFEISKIIEIGKAQLNLPIELLEGVELVLQKLQPRYKLILATKGDLLDQEQKLKKSGLISYFHHIEIMSDKHENNYRNLIKRLDIDPQYFVMIGNSIKSDILPVINIGASAIHVPYHTTWQHENDHAETDNSKFVTVDKLIEILYLFRHKGYKGIGEDKGIKE
jgi:putative hydrolase of the HAD superfamily